MIGFFDLVAERLRAHCPSLLQVETGMSADELVEMLGLGADVTALVTPLSDRASPVRSAGMMVSQEEVWRFGVTLVLVFPGGFAQFDPAYAEVKATLRGWAPPEASMPVEYAGSRVLQYSAAKEGGRWMHLLEFTVPTQATYEHQQ